MKIRTKVSLGFVILSIMLAVAGIFSIYELMKVGTSVQNLLDDNYNSINAGKQMIEALEKEDSGLMLLLSGKWKEGRETIRDADRQFQQALQTAGTNLTIPGEPDLVDRIRIRYTDFSRLWDRPIVGTDFEGNLKWYFTDVHSAFKDVKGAVQELIDLNDRVMYETATDLKSGAHRAVMPGIIAFASALVFTFIFNFFLQIYIVRPIITIIDGIQRFLETNKPVRVTIDTRDELQDLATSVSDLMYMARISK